VLFSSPWIDCFQAFARRINNFGISSRFKGQHCIKKVPFLNIFDDIVLKKILLKPLTVLVLLGK